MFKFEVWPTEYRSINQHFGANPQNYGQFGLPGHEGVDIMAPKGTRIFAVAPGTVSMVRTNPKGHNYGIHIRINHEEGYQTIYAHLQKALVQPGQTVKAGDVIGLADDTGNSFGSHLHLTLKKKGAKHKNWPNEIIDPTPFLLPLLGWQRPAGPYTEGWVYAKGITRNNDLAQANTGGVNLRRKSTFYSDIIDLVPQGTIMIITGKQRGQYVPVKVPTVALSQAEPAPPPPISPPPPTAATVDGWGWKNEITIQKNGQVGVVGLYGIYLRVLADKNSPQIGLVKGGSTVSILGDEQNGYLPIRVRLTDFQGKVNLPEKPPAPPADLSNLPPNTILGWAWTPYLTITGTQAVVGRLGINFRDKPSRSSNTLGLLKGGAIVTIVGKSRGEFTPVLALKKDVELTKPGEPLPPIEQPEPFTPAPPKPEEPEEPKEPEEPQEPAPVDTTPGWVLTSAITIQGEKAIAGTYGLNLRSKPQRNSENLGFIPADTPLLITGAPQGEYTPIRVDTALLQPPFGTAPLPPATGSGESKPAPRPPQNPDPPLLGNARIGLHASADPDIQEAEFQEFADLRPGIIKVLSFHNADDIARLAREHPNASWIVRAFLSFGERNVTPQQFFDWTIDTVKRALEKLAGKDVVVELHNEPNLVSEGWGFSWTDGASFATWWLQVLALYRKELPGTRFIYPGLSPGSDVTGIKEDHIRFVEASREAVEAADGLGVHIYWSKAYPMDLALSVLDDYISRFRYKPIWVTEASNNKAGTSVYMKAQQYLRFWHELQKRPTVQGVTYFVASALNPDFKEEVWVGRGIGKLVGTR
ncbi:MAG: M23 family metallopeptidase [Chloroflexi bacterium]|nr:MAG: M23 family metallopeptidase [Chloroflexota bacterium]